MSLDVAFPVVDPGVDPLGARILVQIKSIKKTTDSGIVLVPDTQAEEKWNTQIAKIIKLGPIAYCNRETGKPWTEGIWAEVGDYVRVPRWGGDRFAVSVPSDEFEKAYFVIFNDHEIIAKITGDLEKVETYIL